MLVRTSSNERTSGLSRYCSTNPIMVSAHTRNCSTTDESVSTTYCRKELSVAESGTSTGACAAPSDRSEQTCFCAGELGRRGAALKRHPRKAAAHFRSDYDYATIAALEMVDGGQVRCDKRYTASKSI